VSEGRTAVRWFFESRPAEAEARAIADVGEVSRRTGTPVYVVHLSSRAGLDAARAARRAGSPLLLETCPQYLVLADGAAAEHPERLVCAPPIRSMSDVQALLSALAAGEIDCLATDHCPFTNAQKARGKDDFRRVPGGLPGVEHMLPFAYDLALSGRLPFERLASLVAASPARLFGLAQRKGRVSAGLDADFVLLDPQAVTEVSSGRLHSRTDWTPYADFWLRGSVRSVYLRGRLAAASGPDGQVEPVAPPGGSYLAAKRSP
jgi:dihydropyrimidinase